VAAANPKRAYRRVGLAMGPGAARREGGGKDNAFTSRAAEVVATPGEVMKHALCVRPAAGHPGASKAAEGRHCARLESSPSASLSWPWPAKWWSTGSGAARPVGNRLCDKMAGDAYGYTPAPFLPPSSALARLRPGGYGLRWLRHDGRDVRGAVRRAVLHRRADG